MSLFRRALGAILGAVCLVLATAAFGPLGGASADPPPQAQNDGNGNSDSPGSGNGNGQGQDNGGGNGGGQGNGGSSGGGQGSGGSDAGGQGSGGTTSGGSSDSNPDGGGLDKPDCEATAEGCQGPAPRDGNNGCGNEAEPKSVRDDDNNGNCGGGQTKDGSDGDGTVAAAGARAAWTSGDPAGVIAAGAVAAQEAARALADSVAAPELDADAEANAEVMGVTVERAAATGGDVDLHDLELARDRASRSGGRSLLALTGTALLTLLAAGLFVLGLGRLFRGAEGDVS